MRYHVGVPVIVDAIPLAALVELVNGWGGTPRREAGEDDWDYPGHSGLLDLWGLPDELVPGTDEGLAAVADRLHPVFAAGEAGPAVSLVNDLLERTAVGPVLTTDGGGLRAAWSVPDPGQALLAAAAVALRQHLAEHSVTRLGTCSGRRCADAYVDTSPTGKRRFCGIACQNRARVAAYRSRRSAT